MDSHTLKTGPSHPGSVLMDAPLDAPVSAGMSNAHFGHGSHTGSLSVAIDRLDRAMEALEARLKALSAPGLPTASNSGDEALRQGYQQALEDLEDARVRESALTEAADGAYETLKLAAANIRLLLAQEAA